MINVAVIYGLTSPSAIDELTKSIDEDSRESALQVGQALSRLGFGTELIEIKPGNLDAVSGINADIVFNLCEWSGLDFALGVGVIERLEKKGVVFTGADSRNFLWGSKKEMMKKMFDQWGFPTPRWGVYSGESEWSLPEDVLFPVIVKPAWEHCSIGIDSSSVVTDPDSLKIKTSKMWGKYRQPILVEEFIESDEYQVTVLERSGEPWVLPPSIISFTKSGPLPILTFYSQWLDPEGPTNAKIRILDKEEKMYSRLGYLCESVFRRFDCRGYVRMDLRERNGEPLLLEINVNPGLEWDMDYGLSLSAVAAGMSWDALVGTIVDSARDAFSVGR